MDFERRATDVGPIEVTRLQPEIFGDRHRWQAMDARRRENAVDRVKRDSSVTKRRDRGLA
jgi:hypothetical protein